MAGGVRSTPQIMSFHRLKLMCSVGGVNVNRDVNQLNSGAPDILVATPGRYKKNIFFPLGTTNTFTKPRLAPLQGGVKPP